MFFKVRNISILTVLTLKNIDYKASFIGILIMLALYFMFFKASIIKAHSKLSSIYHVPHHVKKYTNAIRPMVSCIWIK